MALKYLLREHWFLLGIVLAIIWAKFNPYIGCKGGPLKPEVTVKFIAVSVIFFNSGLSLKTEDLKRAVKQFRLHAYIQCFTLLLVPVMFKLLVSLLEAGPLDRWLLKGLLVVGSMPPPVSSAVIITKAIGGNEAGAIFNSAFGSFLGILFTPMWLFHFMGSSTSVSFMSVCAQLSATIILPLFLGQVVRSYSREALQLLNIPFGGISSVILLLIIYTTFCDTFIHKDVQIDELTLLSIIFLIILLQICLLYLTFYLTTHLNFPPADVIACMFCSTHKSLTLGIPILKVLFGSHTQVSVISIPLLIYHPAQILLGGLLVPSARAWMLDSQRYQTSRRYTNHV